MTTLDTTSPIEDLLDEFRQASRARRLRARWRGISAIQFAFVASVAVVCMNLVH